MLLEYYQTNNDMKDLITKSPDTILIKLDQKIVSTFDVNYDFMQSRYNMNAQISYNKMKCHIKN